ncbi:hypothetical protein TNCV_5053271 [Trichonephila clavipes]|nr:hypothetical protein TNCV_5053271 [Trichonephila clavipes]
MQNPVVIVTNRHVSQYGTERKRGKRLKRTIRKQRFSQHVLTDNVFSGVTLQLCLCLFTYGISKTVGYLNESFQENFIDTDIDTTFNTRQYDAFLRDVPIADGSKAELYAWTVRDYAPFLERGDLRRILRGNNLRAFEDEPLNFEPWSRDEDDTQTGTPSQASTPMGGRRLSLDIFNVLRLPLHGGSPAVLGLNS